MVSVILPQDEYRRNSRSGKQGSCSSRTISPCHAYTLGLHLEAHASFVFPQRRRHSRFHARGSHLAGGVIILLRVPGGGSSRSADVRVLLISTRRHCCHHVSARTWGGMDPFSSYRPGNGSKPEFICCPIDDDTGCPALWGEVTPLGYPYCP